MLSGTFVVQAAQRAMISIKLLRFINLQFGN